MDGIYQNTAEIKSYLHGTANPADKPGDIKFRDLNNDGVINDDDRTFIGNPIPRLSYGFNLNSEYHGFDLSALIQGVSGVDKYNDAKKITDYDSRPFNHSTAVLQAWHGEGTSNTMPRTTFNDNGSSKVSSIFVEDSSYMRLKNLELGYSLGAMRAGSRLGSSERPPLRLRPEPVYEDQVHRARSRVDRHSGPRNVSVIQSIPVWNQRQILIRCQQLIKEREA